MVSGKGCPLPMEEGFLLHDGPREEKSSLSLLS